MDLEKKCNSLNVKLKYPWYSGWAYQPEGSLQDDNFLKLVVQQLEASPALVQRMKACHAEVFLCSDFRKTHLQQKLFWGRADSSPACCDARRGEIYLARESYDVEVDGFVSTQDPAFIIGHELAHHFDSLLGKIIDPYGIDPPVSASAVDPYAKDSFEKDVEQQANDSMTLLRPRLLSEEGSIGRSSATEILCDMVSYELVDQKAGDYKTLKSLFPSLYGFSRIMLAASTSDENIKLYREAADNKCTLKELSKEFGLH